MEVFLDFSITFVFLAALYLCGFLISRPIWKHGVKPQLWWVAPASVLFVIGLGVMPDIVPHSWHTVIVILSIPTFFAGLLLPIAIRAQMRANDTNKPPKK